MGGSLEAPLRWHVVGDVGLSPLKVGSHSLSTAQSWKRVGASLSVSPSLPLPTDLYSLCVMRQEPYTHVSPKEVTVSSEMESSLA